VLAGSGLALSRVAFEETFGTAATARLETQPTYSPDLLPAEVRAKIVKVKDVKSLHREYPALRRPSGGQPKGYPRGQGDLVIGRWCREVATTYECERRGLSKVDPTMPTVEPIATPTAKPVPSEPAPAVVDPVRPEAVSTLPARRFGDAGQQREVEHMPGDKPPAEEPGPTIPTLG
jgi:hypothetical protein